MVTDDDVMHLFERADPARFDHDAAAPRLDATEYLDALRTRSNTMTMIDTRPPAAEQMPSRRRWPRVAAAAAAFAAFAIGAVVVGSDDQHGDDPSTPATEPPIATAAPATLAAEAAAREFLDAYGALAAEQALSRLSPAAIENLFGTAEQFRDHIAYLAAIGFSQDVTGCRVLPSDGPGVRVRCEYDMHAIRSAELGLGPFSGNYWNFNVVDGRIDAASFEWTYEENGFSRDVWEPFAQWISSTYPGDVAVMYTDLAQTMYRVTPESRELWEQRTIEYAHTGAGHLSRARSICAAAGVEASATVADARPRPPRGSAEHLAMLAPFLHGALEEIATLPPPPAARTTFDQLQASGREVVDLWSGVIDAPTLTELSTRLSGLIGGSECTFGLR